MKRPAASCSSACLSPITSPVKSWKSAADLLIEIEERVRNFLLGAPCHEVADEIRRAVAACLFGAKRRGRAAGRIPVHARAPFQSACANNLDPARAVGRGQRQTLECADPLFARA